MIERDLLDEICKSIVSYIDEQYGLESVLSKMKALDVQRIALQHFNGQKLASTGKGLLIVEIQQAAILKQSDFKDTFQGVRNLSLSDANLDYILAFNRLLELEQSNYFILARVTAIMQSNSSNYYETIEIVIASEDIQNGYHSNSEDLANTQFVDIIVNASDIKM